MSKDNKIKDIFYQIDFEDLREIIEEKLNRKITKTEQDIIEDNICNMFDYYLNENLEAVIEDIEEEAIYNL